MLNRELLSRPRSRQRANDSLQGGVGGQGHVVGLYLYYRMYGDAIQITGNIWRDYMKQNADYSEVCYTNAVVEILIICLNLSQIKEHTD